jgi:hypothetical protein
LQVAQPSAIKMMLAVVLVMHLVKLFKMLDLNGPKNCVKQTAMGMDKQMGLNWETLTAVGIQATLPKLPQNFHILEKIHQNLAV